MDKQTYNNYVEKMKSHIHDSDKECSHWEGDKLLIDFIKELGYNELADAWELIGKWYA